MTALHTWIDVHGLEAVIIVILFGISGTCAGINSKLKSIDASLKLIGGRLSGEHH